MANIWPSIISTPPRLSDWAHARSRGFTRRRPLVAASHGVAGGILGRFSGCSILGVSLLHGARADALPVEQSGRTSPRSSRSRGRLTAIGRDWRCGTQWRAPIDWRTRSRSPSRLI